MSTGPIQRFQPDTKSAPLPCPFCGKNPVFLTTTEDDSFQRCFEVRCDTCGIGISEEYRNDTVERWNARTSPVEYVPVDQLIIDALTELSAMYSSTWDKVDGGLSMLGSGVDRFELAHEKAQRALVAYTNAKPGPSIPLEQSGGK